MALDQATSVFSHMISYFSIVPLCVFVLCMFSNYFNFNLFLVFCYEPSESGKCLTNLLLQNILDKKASFVLLNGLYVEILFKVFFRASLWFA